MNSVIDDREEPERPSKSQRKRDMAALQDLGTELVMLNADQLAQIELPERLHEAIADAQRIRDFEGRRRQMQFIGKLMRETDPAPIRAKLDEWSGVARAGTAQQRLVERWREPLDAMAELEALMFRRDGGELFELPAYREVLFLYSMARDLLDHQGGPPTSIDVLLPLGDREQEFEPTTARPHLFTTPTGLAELSRASEPSIEMLRPSRTLRPSTSDEPPSVYGTIDVDLTKPLPMDDDTQVFRREDTELRNPDQRSDFADLPPPPTPKRKG